MITKVLMEALSPTMEEGKVLTWLKQEGDTVADGDVLAEVETDKAVMELLARGAGVLRTILAGDGATVEVGSLVAIIADPDDDITALAGGGAAPPVTILLSRPRSAPVCFRCSSIESQIVGTANATVTSSPTISS